jgi:hypothetical protein
VLAVDTLDLTLGATALVFALLAAAIYLARHDRVTRVKLGIFFERERQRDEETPPSEPETKIMGPWPGEKKEDE